MILVDTSVWIEHFRVGSDRLKHLLFDEEVLCHPFIIGELACGILHKRGEILSLLRALPAAKLLEHDEVLAFSGGAATVWTWHWLGGCPSSCFHAAHTVHDLDL